MPVHRKEVKGLRLERVIESLGKSWGLATFSQAVILYHAKHNPCSLLRETGQQGTHNREELKLWDWSALLSMVLSPSSWLRQRKVLLRVKGIFAIVKI